MIGFRTVALLPLRVPRFEFVGLSFVENVNIQGGDTDTPCLVMTRMPAAKKVQAYIDTADFGQQQKRVRLPSQVSEQVDRRRSAVVPYVNTTGHHCVLCDCDWLQSSCSVLAAIQHCDILRLLHHPMISD